jgi:hypothetical protein
MSDGSSLSVGFASQDAAGFADAAIADKALARAVADHKAVFFAEKNTHCEVIDV